MHEAGVMAGSEAPPETDQRIGLRRRWHRFAQASALRRLGQATLVAAAAALGAKGVGFVREMVVASAFGLADGVDVYLMAFVVVGFPLSILLNAAQTSLVAAIAGARHEAPDTALAYGTSAAATLGIAALVVPLWLAFTGSAMPWIASGFPPAKQEALHLALWTLVPYTVLNALNLLGYGVLQARHRYAAVGLLPVLTPLAICAAVIARPGSDAWPVLAGGLVAGTAAECIAVNWAILRIGVRARCALRSAPFQRVARATLQLLPGSLFMALGPLAEQAIAAALGSGTIAALGYGNRIPAALSGILVAAIGTTVLPHFAAMLAAGDAAYCLHSLRKLGRLLLGAGSLVAVSLALASHPITAAVFERGAFDAASTLRVTPVQQAYFLQLPAALVAMLALRTLAAARRNDIVSALTVAAILVQIALAWTLGRRLGAEGIAIAATIASAFSALTAYAAASRLLRRRAP